MSEVRRPLTSAILGGDIPTRADDFTFTLVDSAGATLGTLNPSSDSPAKVAFDSSRTTARTLSGMQLYRSDLLAIDVEREWVRVAAVIQNGESFPIGRFMFGMDNQASGDWGVLGTPDMFDRMFLLDEGLGETVALRPGSSVQGMVYRALLPFGITAVFGGDDVLTATPLVFLAGSSRYVLLKHAADLLGCFPPFFDNQEQLVYRFPRDEGDTTIDHEYGPATTIVDDTVQVSSSSYKAPNRYIVVGDGQTAPIVGIYNLPDSAPHSAKNRDGRIVTSQRTVQGLADSSLAQHLAWIDALTDRTPYGSVSFDALANPRHDGFDTLLVNGRRYLESSWELTCVSGGPHRHVGSEMWAQ